MTWFSEAQMVDTFIKTMKLQKKNPQNDIIIVHEANTNYGRPDIMIIEYDTSVIRQRSEGAVKKEMRPFTSMCAYAMSYLSPEKWTSLEDLQTFLNCGKGKVVGMVNDLGSRNLVYVDENAVCARRPRESFALTQLLVFEAKLDKWKEAITQAERHLWFTGSSYIVLPADKKGVFNNAACECTKRGIGLLSFSDKGSIDCIVQPTDMQIYNTYFSWLINEQIFEKCGNGINV